MNANAMTDALLAEALASLLRRLEGQPHGTEAVVISQFAMDLETIAKKYVTMANPNVSQDADSFKLVYMRVYANVLSLVVKDYADLVREVTNDKLKEIGMQLVEQKDDNVPHQRN